MKISQINGQAIQKEKEAFFKFMDDLKYDLVTNKVLLEGNIREQADAYKKLFGENMVNKVYENIAQKLEKKEKNQICTLKKMEI